MLDETGYLGFYIDRGNGVEIKELQIELGDKKTSYEEYQYVMETEILVNLEDRKNEIFTNDYYIKIYKKMETIVPIFTERKLKFHYFRFMCK